MCGIAGIMGWSGSKRDLERRILAMRKALRHRGPDDEGIWMSEDAKGALGHTRLSILDLSVAGRQPMGGNGTKTRIVFNGEIYNFRNLRRKLEAAGRSLETQSDTEVILNLYEGKGIDCVQLLRGMYAFAIYDSINNSCFLARDPFGIKPLYYTQVRGTLLFASEVRSLIASNLFQPALSEVGLRGYLRTGSVPEPWTLLQDVFVLPAGHRAFWRAGQGLRIEEYWKMQFPGQTSAEENSVERTRQALLDTIEAHFVSDVPVGIFLSGGIDSASILSLSRRQFGSGIRTFSIAFSESEWDEGPLAHRVADHFGAEHSEHLLQPREGREIFHEYLESLDQPSIDGFNTYCVSRLARSHDMKVVLSGLGGDELFGGYQSFSRLSRITATGKRVQFSGVSLLGRAVEKWSPTSKLKRLGDFLQQPPTMTSAYELLRCVFTRSETGAIAEEFGIGGEEYPEGGEAPFTPPGTVHKRSDPEEFPTAGDFVSYLEFTRYMRNQLLRDSDVMSMGQGLELRVPFVDRELFEVVASIPAGERHRSGKSLLVDAVGDLPDLILNRPKRGFLFPLESWMRNEWRDLFEDVAAPRRIPLQPWYRRWALKVLTHWIERNGVSM